MSQTAQLADATTHSLAPRASGPTPRTAAVVAGLGYLGIFLLAIFANFFVITGLVHPDDAAATFADIADHATLFRFGAASFLVVFLLDIVVAWALYVLFRPVHQGISLLAAWFRLVYTVFLGVGVVFLMGVSELVGGAAHLGAFDQPQLESQATLMLKGFDYAWLTGLAAFGIHLMLVAWLLVRTPSVSPKLRTPLGLLLGVAGTAYLADTLAHMLLSDYAAHADAFLVMVAVPSVLGEMGFAVWLLARGGRR